MFRIRCIKGSENVAWSRDGNPFIALHPVSMTELVVGHAMELDRRPSFPFEVGILVIAAALLQPSQEGLDSKGDEDYQHANGVHECEAEYIEVGVV